MNAEEAWQMLILGTYCILLGIVLMNKNEKLIIQLANLILIGIGSILIIRANSHHYWLYFPISFLFFLPFLNNFLKFKKLLLVNLALFIGAVFSIQIIIDGLIAIQNSSSNIDMSPLSNLKKMEYPAFPLSYFIGLPLLHDFYNYLNINWPLNGIIPAGEGFFGPSMLILSIIGFLNIKNNYLRFGILLLLFYWIGPLQLFLRLVVGGPFITETSVGGRLGVYVYIILLTLSVHAIINNLNEIKKYNKLIYFYSFSVIIIQIITHSK